MKSNIFTLLLVLFSFNLTAQNTGDYRTIATGNWETLSNWESYNGTTWVTASTLPSSSSGIININHNQNVTTNQTISTAIVASSVTLTVGSGGRLHLGSNAITGAGNFTVATGGYLQIGHTDGIATTGASGNVQVTGTRSYATGGYYEFAGTVAQTTGTGLPSSIRGFIVNNAAGLTINKNDSIVITDSLSFRNGILYTSLTNKNYLVMEQGSTVRGVYTVSSFLRGPIRLIFRLSSSVCFDIPFGHNTHLHRLRTCMSHNNADPNIYEWEVNSPNIDVNNIKPNSVHSVSTDFYWRQDPVYVPSALTQQSIRAYWTSSDGIQNMNKLTVARYNGQWDKLTGSPAIVTGSTNSAGSLDCVNNSQARWYYTLASEDNSNTLPVDFLSMKASLKANNSVRVDWETASELNNDYFTLYRIVHGDKEKSIGRIKGKENSNEKTAYSFMDNFAPDGKIRYVLYQTDLDGSTHFFGTTSVRNELTETAKVFPNPCHNFLDINVSDDFEGHVILIDIEGRIIKSVAFSSCETTTLRLPMEDVPVGIYFLNLYDGHKVLHKRVVKN